MTYTGGLELVGSVITGWTLYAQLVTALPSSTAETLDEVPSPNRIGSPVALTGKAVIGPPVAVTAADVLVTDAAALTVAAGLLIYRQETGQTEAQSVLLAGLDISPAVTLDGGAVNVILPTGGFLVLED